MSKESWQTEAVKVSRFTKSWITLFPLDLSLIPKISKYHFFKVVSNSCYEIIVRSSYVYSRSKFDWVKPTKRWTARD